MLFTKYYNFLLITVICFLNSFLGYIQNPDGIEDFPKLFENKNENENEIENEDENEDDYRDNENESESFDFHESDSESELNQNMNENKIINENEFHDTIKNESYKMQSNKKCSDISLDATKMLCHPIMDLSSAYLIDGTGEAKA